MVQKGSAELAEQSVQDLRPGAGQVPGAGLGALSERGFRLDEDPGGLVVGLLLGAHEERGALLLGLLPGGLDLGLAIGAVGRA